MSMYFIFREYVFSKFFCSSTSVFLAAYAQTQAEMRAGIQDFFFFSILTMFRQRLIKLCIMKFLIL
jgi:hypothetical protein